MESDKPLAELLDDSSFVAWIKGEADKETNEKWQKWEAESFAHTQIKNDALLLLDASESFHVSDGTDVEARLANLNRRIDKKELPVSRIDAESASNYRRNWPVAASVVLLLAVISGIIALVYNQPQGNHSLTNDFISTVKTTYGEQSSLELSDGSKIKLNSNSTLRYRSNQFGNDNVEFWLKGEGYFDVVQNSKFKDRKFIVYTPDGKITVLGTRFNVNARYDYTGVVLEKGSVEIEHRDSTTNQTRVVQLKPDERAEFSGSHSEIKIMSVDVFSYTAWLEDKIVFDQTPLSEIIRHIRETYGVHIEVEQSGLLKKEITGTIRNSNLETLLEGIEELFNLTIHRQGEDAYLFQTKPSL